MISHHPDDSLLLAHAAGRLGAGDALLLAVHLEGCARCRAELRLLEGLGGALLEAAEPAPMAPQALARTLARIDASRAEVPLPAPAAHPPRPHGMAWPTALADCRISGWRWLAPGMRWSRVTLPRDASAHVFLLRIGAGRSLARHTHSGSELTQVLCGRFDDGRAVFGPGDFDAADGDVHHQPIVQAGSECICLASVDGRLVFDGSVARLLGALIGM
ncbi:MAG: cupin domain-containing protein [Proteobacteria bacterium]|nr:cupin domain-containing protein [Pseudomonadota bacterium]